LTLGERSLKTLPAMLLRWLARILAGRAGRRRHPARLLAVSASVPSTTQR
jgi:hypothetical protein